MTISYNQVRNNKKKQKIQRSGYAIIIITPKVITITNKTMLTKATWSRTVAILHLLLSAAVHNLIEAKYKIITVQKLKYNLILAMVSNNHSFDHINRCHVCQMYGRWTFLKYFNIVSAFKNWRATIRRCVSDCRYKAWQQFDAN